MSALKVAAKPVAFARICIGLAAIGTTLEAHAFLIRIADGRLALPVFESWPSPSDLPLTGLLGLGVLAGLLLALGSCTRTCAAMIVILQAVTLASDQQLYSSHRLLLMVLCCHLVFAQSDAAWSLRARFRGSRESVPAWPQVLMIGALSSLYLFAGLSKINGIFLSGDVLQVQMVIHVPGWAYPLLSFATVTTEISIAVGLWFARTRLLAVVAGLGLHVSIVLLLGNPFVLASFGLLCVGLYPMVLTRPTPAPSARRAIPVRGERTRV